MPNPFLKALFRTKSGGYFPHQTVRGCFPHTPVRKSCFSAPPIFAGCTLTGRLGERGTYDQEAVDVIGVDMSTFTNTRGWRAGSLTGQVPILTAARNTTTEPHTKDPR